MAALASSLGLVFLGSGLTSVTRSPRSSRTYRMAPAKSASFDKTNRLFVLPVESVHQQTRGEVHVRSLLLRVPDEDVSRQSCHRLRQRATLDAGPEDAVVGVEARQRRQRSQVRLLPLALRGIAGAGVEPSREVADPVDRVLGKEGLGQLSQVEPPERRVLQGAVVEIEAVYVQIGDQFPPPQRQRPPRRAVSTLPPKR